MASQFISIAKIAGEGGTVIGSIFRDWSAKRTAEELSEWSPEHWPADVHRQVDRFVSSLCDNCNRPPVVFSVEYVDSWSMWGELIGLINSDESQSAISIASNHCDLWCYTLPDQGRLHSSLKKSLRQHGWTQEQRWFLKFLLEAVNAWEPLVESAALIAIRKVFDGMLTDEDLKSSLHSMPEWLSLH